MKGDSIIFLLVIITIMAVISLPVYGYVIGREKALKCQPCVVEKTVYATSTEIITEYATTTVIDEKCAWDLQNCWYLYNTKGCPECEDVQSLKDEITSLLISRQEAKENESRLLEQLNECQTLD